MIVSNRIFKNNFIDHILEALSSNSDGSHYYSSIINTFHHLAETYEDKIISVAGDYGSTFSCQMSVVETVCIISDAGLSIS